MKILYIIKSGMDDVIKKIIEEHKKEHIVETIDIRTNKDYDYIVSAIERADKVISW
jgi:2-hydroxy-3-keto-5-methylthiopentenyl-1-phosphate phosphatase